MSDQDTINGVPTDEIAIPFVLRMTCVGCEESRSFEPTDRDGNVVTYECVSCEKRALLSLDA